MKHKVFLFILFSVLVTPALYAYDFKYGDLYYNVTDETARTVEVTYEEYWSDNNYSGLTKVVIPETAEYNGENYSVTSIGDWAFYDCSGLTEVIIGNGVTSIGDYAFGFCSGLTKVVIGNSITSIGDYAFARCTGLTEVVIPNSVTSIANYAFSECSGLREITIPKSVEDIGDEAFNNCRGLRSIVVAEGNTIYDSRGGCNAIIETATNTLLAGCQTTTIPNSVTSIGDGAFGGCSGLTEVVIPEGVTSIGRFAFSGCSGLTEVVIGNSVTSIGWCAFSGCSGLTEVVIPNSVTSIGEGAFYHCYSLTEVVIGEGVTSIGDEAFYGCSGLTEVVIPNSVTGIGKSSFEFCTSLTEVVIGESVTSIGDRAFTNCNGLKTVTWNAIACEDSPFQNCSSITSFSFGDKVQNIPSRLCYGLNAMTEITIPAGVTDIGAAAFYDCRRLQSVTSLATTPPSIYVENGSETFGNIPRYTILYVYEQYLEDYKFSDWSLFFGDLRPIADQETGLEDVYGEGGGAAEGDRAADGVDNGAARKVMRDGKLLIIHGEETYTATGVRIQ